VTVLSGRAGCFSAGFDLKVFQRGDAAEVREMLRAGAELALRVLSFPTPVVTVCAGHAYPMGAFLLLSADLRLCAEGPFKIGLNEVTIGLTIPRFAIEVARQRLTPAWFNRAAASELAAAAEEAALRLAKVDMAAHHATKLCARGPAIAAVRAAIDEELGSGR
jgi:enoyl-CoA hydratase